MAANSFMLTALNDAYKVKAEQVSEAVKGSKLTPTTKEVVAPLVEIRESMAKNPQMMQVYQMLLSQPQTQQRLKMASGLAQPDSEDRRVLDSLQELLNYDRFPTNNSSWLMLFRPGMTAI